MDPLTALGLGANIFQVIEFGAELAKLTRDVIKSGDIYDYDRLGLISFDLQDLVCDLSQAKNQHGDISHASIEKPTLALTSLAQECKAEAEAMISKLDHYRPRVKTTGKFSRGAALKTAALAMWNKPEIEMMAQRFDRYRIQLALRMLDVLNARSINQGTSVVEILSLTHRVNSTVRGIAALLKTADGSMKTILSDKRPPQADTLADALSVTYHDHSLVPTVHDDGETPRQHATTTEVSFAEIARKILSSLWFAFISSRENTVEDPFGETFSWVSDEQNVEGREWDNFPNWLRTGRGWYWINGKAGSGKSTLMKHIANHPLLIQNLRIWADGDDLLRGSFFFWRAAMDPLAKTQEGLLRSLLLQILDKRRDLVTVCFPTLCRKLAFKDQFHQELKISFDELKTAFSLLTRYHLPKTKVFLLVDGLDEYQGDHRDLVNLLSQATAAPGFKMLVSSRPVPLLFQAFIRCPGLKMHNLTLGDIRHYAQEKLRFDNTLNTMDRIEMGLSHQIVDNIVSKASGVFLWVKIVVRDLLYGLAHHDTLETLLQNLDKLPTDLEQLYDHMFTSMTPSYRREASRMMRLFKRSQEVQFDFPMTALQLVFAQMKEAAGSTDVPWKFLSEIEENAHCELIEGWLRSRCCGLLEVQKSYWGLQDSRKYVDFLHRTVLEYLDRGNIQTQLLTWDTTPTNIDEVLFSSCVMEIRQYTKRNQIGGVPVARSYNVRTILQHQGRAPSTGTRILHAVALSPSLRSSKPEIDDVIMKELTQAFLALPDVEREEVNKRALGRAIHPTLDRLAFTPDDSSQGFWMYAALQGIGFASGSPSEAGFRDAQGSSLALINNLLYLSHPRSGEIPSRIVRGVTQLVAAGADPNEPCMFFDSFETTHTPPEIEAAVRLAPGRDNPLIPWLYWLSCKGTESPIIARDYLVYIRILACMLTSGTGLPGFLRSVDRKAVRNTCDGVEKCVDGMSDTSREAQSLCAQIRATVRATMSSPAGKEDSRLSRRMSRAWTLPLRLSKGRNGMIT